MAEGSTRPIPRIWCDRCRASSPFTEWRLSSTGETLKHLGPMHDGPDYICEPDDAGSVVCGWVKSIPQPISSV